MARITDDDLERLKRLFVKSTAGTWKVGDTFVYSTDAGNGLPRDIFAYEGSRYTYEDCEFVVAAHELMPALLAEIMVLRSHLSPAVDAPAVVGAGSAEEVVVCPTCASHGPFTQLGYVVFETTIQTYTCRDCETHFQVKDPK